MLATMGVVANKVLVVAAVFGKRCLQLRGVSPDMQVVCLAAWLEQV
jgi:hypothetical protein